MSRRARIPAIVLTAAVGGVYSTIVIVVLLGHALQRAPKVPTDLPEYVAIKQELAQHPQDAGLRERLRQFDQQIRLDYFRSQRFLTVGTWLLLAGVGVTLVAVTWLASLRRPLPQPVSPPPGFDPELRVRRFSLISVTVLVLAIAAATWPVRWWLPTSLPSQAVELNAVADASPSRADVERSGSVTATPGPAGDASRREEPLPPTSLPTMEQRRDEWPSFRGSDGSGTTRLADAPTHWNGTTGEGIRWKSAVPLPGVGSPIVWGDRVFLSGGTESQREVYCWDADNGQLLWRREVPSPNPQAAGELNLNPDTGLAACTMATDGMRVYAMFATGDLAACDFAGRLLWSLSLGVPKSAYGHAASLAVYQDRVIIQFDQGRTADKLSRLMALEGATGKTAWETARDVPNSWASPIVVQHAEQNQIVTCANPWVIAYTADAGQELWRAACLQGDVAPSPVYLDGMVYAVNDQGGLSAIRAGGQGDVTETHVAWTGDAGLPDTCSPLATGEFVLLLASYGTLTCYDRAAGGEPLWEEDFGVEFLSSPVQAGSRVYLISRSGKGWVVEPGRDACRRVSETDLGEDCSASPAFQGKRIFVRGAQHLFCIAEPAS